VRSLLLRTTAPQRRFDEPDRAKSDFTAGGPVRQRDCLGWDGRRLHVPVFDARQGIFQDRYDRCTLSVFMITPTGLGREIVNAGYDRILDLRAPGAQPFGHAYANVVE
jgi:hypothetical protein